MLADRPPVISSIRQHLLWMSITDAAHGFTKCIFYCYLFIYLLRHWCYIALYTFSIYYFIVLYFCYCNFWAFFGTRGSIIFYLILLILCFVTRLLYCKFCFVTSGFLSIGLFRVTVITSSPITVLFRNIDWQLHL